MALFSHSELVVLRDASVLCKRMRLRLPTLTMQQHALHRRQRRHNSLPRLPPRPKHFETRKALLVQ